MPAFGHRHYKAIAGVLADARDKAQERGLRKVTYAAAADEAVTDLEARLVRMFEADNPGFKPERFIAAATRAPNMHGKDK